MTTVEQEILLSMMGLRRDDGIVRLKGVSQAAVKKVAERAIVRLFKKGYLQHGYTEETAGALVPTPKAIEEMTEHPDAE